MKRLWLGVICTACAVSVSWAQPSKPDGALYLSSKEQVQALKPDKSGLYAQTMLARRDKSLAMITTRDKSGEAELHAAWTDDIFVQDGEATMILGGDIQNPRSVSAGETRGSGITGGKTVTLHAGDYVFVPVNVAHRMMIAPGKTIRYAVVKTRP